MKRNPFLSAFFPKYFRLCWFLLVFLTQAILCVHSSRNCSSGTYFMTQSCVVAPHTHCIQKGAANSPQSMPWSWIFSWTLKFWVSCEIFGLWVSVKEEFFYKKAGRLLFFGFFFPSNNYFKTQTAEAFRCHSLTSELCFPPVDVATSKGSGGSCVLCSFLMSSLRW